jgi:putative Mg2+ transporter-C (MgtC) family protein
MRLRGPQALIGVERQWPHKMAGTRTNAPVSAGAAAFAMVGVALAGDTSAARRIAGQIVSGAGFLGAGVRTAAIP